MWPASLAVAGSDPIETKWHAEARGIMSSQPIRLPKTLSDGVVVLDGHTLSDAQAHWDGEDAEMVRRFEAPRHATLHEVRCTMQRWMDARAAGRPNFCYAIRMSDGLLVGGCEVRWLTASPNAAQHFLLVLSAISQARIGRTRRNTDAWRGAGDRG